MDPVQEIEILAFRNDAWRQRDLLSKNGMVLLKTSPYGHDNHGLCYTIACSRFLYLYSAL